MTGLYLAQYRIDAELGRGGMGIVYRATDTKLDRTVALKVLPPHALASADDRARFYREAKAAAQLHHPHIATVFQIDEAPLLQEAELRAPDAEARPFIAMEYVDGESIAERIRKGPFKLEEVIRVTSQVAEALAAAHEAGIVHRDIKSGNVMLTSKGEVKVLDFGLAKTAASTQLTRQGSTLGTIAYMSPEQARGEEVDRRTDLWALGVVLYEMIAGRLPFQADYEQATLYGILNEDPEPVTALRTGVPMEIERVVDKLLAKDRKHRYQTAADVVADLARLSASDSSSSRIGLSRVSAGRVAPARRGTPNWIWPALFVAALLGSVATWMANRPGTPTLRVYDSAMEGLQVVALSYAGDRYAYVARDTLFVRSFADYRPVTLGYSGPVQFLTWSLDGDAVAWARANEVWKVRSTGGTPERLATFETGSVFGLAWIDADRILASVRSGTGLGDIHAIPTSGGRTTEFRKSDTERGIRSYEALAYDIRDNVLYAAARDDQARSVIIRLQDDGYTLLTDQPSERLQGLAVGGDHTLIATSDDGLWAWQLSPDGFAVEGEPVRLAPSGARSPSLSKDGTLAYLQGPPENYELRAVSSTGTLLGTYGRGAAYLGNPVMLPDEERIVVSGSGFSLWLMDIRGSASRLETGYTGIQEAASLLPDGRRVIVGSFKGGKLGAFVLDTGSAREPHRLDTGDQGTWGASVSRDGRRLAFYILDETSLRDLYWAELDVRADTVAVTGGPFVYLKTQADEATPVIHPSGDWLAYQTNASGRWEVVVRSFPDPDIATFAVTADGGRLPRWSPDGRTLYYQGEDQVLRFVPFDAGTGRAGVVPTEVVRVAIPRTHTPFEASYAIGPTTGLVVAKVDASEDRTPVLMVIQNWSIGAAR